MSAPRRRRLIDVLRRTAGMGETGASRGGPRDDAALWTTHEQATRALVDSGAVAERVAASVTRQRSSIEGAGERASAAAARAAGLAASAARILEAFERLGVVALNAGLEGARVPEAQGRALLLLSEEVRANVVRGADGARDLTASIEELANEATEVRRQLDRARAEVADVVQDAASLRTSTELAGSALGELGQRLRKLTGLDPEVARAVSAASEHARGLMTALSALSTAAASAPALAALGPVVAPLRRMLSELAEEPDDEPPAGR